VGSSSFFLVESALNTLVADVIEATAKSSDAINSIIKWTKQSDFRFLQDHFQGYVNHLDLTLAGLTERIIINRGQSNTDVSGTFEDSQHENGSLDSSRPENEGNWADTNLPSGHGNHQPGTSLSADSSEEISLRPQLIKLAKTTIPLIKLTRILFKKLSSKTLTNKALFTFDTQLSSEEIQEINNEFRNLSSILEALLELMFHIYDSDELMNYMMRLEKLHVGLSHHFDSSTYLLPCYLTPVNDQLDLVISRNHFETWLLTLSEQFHVADGNFTQALSCFKDAMQP
jgi:hypothetical protein